MSRIITGPIHTNTMLTDFIANTCQQGYLSIPIPIRFQYLQVFNTHQRYLGNLLSIPKNTNTCHTKTYKYEYQYLPIPINDILRYVEDLASILTNTNTYQYQFPVPTRSPYLAITNYYQCYLKVGVKLSVNTTNINIY